VGSFTPLTEMEYVHPSVTASRLYAPDKRDQKDVDLRWVRFPLGGPLIHVLPFEVLGG